MISNVRKRSRSSAPGDSRLFLPSASQTRDRNLIGDMVGAQNNSSRAGCCNCTVTTLGTVFSTVIVIKYVTEIMELVTSLQSYQQKAVKLL